MSQQGMRTFSTEYKQAVVLRLEAGVYLADSGGQRPSHRVTTGTKH